MLILSMCASMPMSCYRQESTGALLISRRTWPTFKESAHG